MTPEVIALGLIWYVVFLLSTTCHEAAHAFVSKREGDFTAFEGGQVTLNPLPHIRREPFGMFLFPIVSFLMGGWMMGWASAPYDPAWSSRYPHRAAKMALAGPTANFLLAVAAGILIHLGLLLGVFHPPASAGFTEIVAANRPGLAQLVAQVLSLLFSLNVLLGFQSASGPASRRICGSSSPDERGKSPTVRGRWAKFAKLQLRRAIA